MILLESLRFSGPFLTFMYLSLLSNHPVEVKWQQTPKPKTTPFKADVLSGLLQK